MNYLIRKAKVEDTDAIIEIVKDVVKNKEDSGLNWDDSYPNKEVYLKDIENDKLYVIILNNKVLGAIATYEELDKEYENVNWNVRDGLVIHRLVVHREYQKLGLGSLLMEYVENEAKKLNIESIKLDTYSKNIKGVNFYKKNGYKIKGNINLAPWKEKFYCFEKLL